MAYLRHTDFYIPVLKVLEDFKEHEVNNLIEETAVHCRLNEEERKAPTRHGTQLKYQSNIQWAITDLCQGGFIERTSRGVYRIMFDGLLMLEDNPEKPTRDYLEARSEKFKEFRHRKGSRSRKRMEEENLFKDLSEEDIDTEETTNQVESISTAELTSEAEGLLKKYLETRSMMAQLGWDTTEADKKIGLLQEGILRNKVSKQIEGFINQLKDSGVRDCSIIVDLFDASGATVFISHEKDEVKEICKNATKIDLIGEITVDSASEHGESLPLRQLSTDTFANKDSRKEERNLPKGKKQPPKGLRVTFNDGTVIEGKYAADVFAKTIERIGPEKIVKLGLFTNGFPLVGRKAPEKYQYKEVKGGWFVPVNSSTLTKKRFLEEIAGELGIGVAVEVIG